MKISRSTTEHLTEQKNYQQKRNKRSDMVKAPALRVRWTGRRHATAMWQSRHHCLHPQPNVPSAHQTHGCALFLRARRSTGRKNRPQIHRNRIATRWHLYKDPAGPKIQDASSKSEYSGAHELNYLMQGTLMFFWNATKCHFWNTDFMFILSTLDLTDMLCEIQLKRTQLWLPNHRVAEPYSYPSSYSVVCLRPISKPLSLWLSRGLDLKFNFFISKKRSVMNAPEWIECFYNNN